MVKEVFLNNTKIQADNFQVETANGLHKISFDFKVKSDEYHDITTLLYEGIFDVKVLGNGLAFRGKIQQYSTSVTNLYEKGQVGDFKLSLLEVKD